MFVLNCVDGCIPSDLATGSSEEIEEERRLLYVAMTRARDELTLIVPQRFYVHGQPKNGDRSVFAARTRFIPPPLLKHFDRQTRPVAEAEPTRAVSEGPRVKSVGATKHDILVSGGPVPSVSRAAGAVLLHCKRRVAVHAAVGITRSDRLRGWQGVRPV